MPFILVPHQVTDTTATIWVGAMEENGVRQRSVSIELDDGDETRTVQVDASSWQTWESYREGDEDSYPALDRFLDRVLVKKPPPVIRTLDYQRVEVEMLQPRMSYSLNLRVDDQHVVGPERYLREGRVTTLPAALPGRDEKPFTLLLGSCFYRPEDNEGMVGATYHYMSQDQRPDVKVLCGDQVYLDNPWLDTTARWYGGNYRRGLFREMLFKKYVDTWRQVTSEDAGFQQLLKDGANYFCSDDHEFWNNAPNFGGVGFINTLTQKQRDWWLATARELFEAFQSPHPLTQFEVSPLSVCIADTRIDRDPERKRFMKDENLRAVGGWIEELRGPGVLVVGQPVLAGGTSLRRSLLENLKETAWSWLDGNLSDYAQYEELVGYIKSSDHAIVLLSGDVHFGRIACVRPRPGSNDATLVEVISSPMQLVLERKMKRFGTYEEAPTDHFPINENHEAAEGNHFATVEFTLREEGRVDMQVRAWPILRPGEEVSPSSDPIFQATLS